MNEATLQVRGMRCSRCVHTILHSLGKAGASAAVDLAAGTVTVRFDERLRLETVVAAIEEQGYAVER